MYIYDSKRVFWPTSAPANGIPINIQSDTELSNVKNVQDAVQYLADQSSGGVHFDDLPDDLQPTQSTLKNTIQCINQILAALKKVNGDG